MIGRLAINGRGFGEPTVKKRRGPKERVEKKFKKEAKNWTHYPVNSDKIVQSIVVIAKLRDSDQQNAADSPLLLQLRCPLELAAIGPDARHL